MEGIVVRHAVVPQKHGEFVTQVAHSLRKGGASQQYRTYYAGPIERKLIRTEDGAFEEVDEKESDDGHVAEAPWNVAEWVVALRFDNPRVTVPVLLIG